MSPGRDAVRERREDAAAHHLLQHPRIVGQAPGGIGVVLVAGARAQCLRFDLPRITGREVGAQRDVLVAVAVAVRVRGGDEASRAGKGQRIEEAARLEGLTFEEAMERRKGFRYLY